MYLSGSGKTFGGRNRASHAMHAVFHKDSDHLGSEVENFRNRHMSMDFFHSVVFLSLSFDTAVNFTLCPYYPFLSGLLHRFP